ncbi:cytochrome c biogenesis CcdA family protein [Microcella sp.]|uniref:cytochrome c biogenesis CcdA family protein n=1 Tax=Microcella sp. TaxID=1913979 RepID=UPI0025D042F5|nr:cytochrome c biogenesis protein CcdA [Microcella sp.]
MITLAAAVNPIGEIVLSGNLLLALPIALAAGFLAFASPCVLPLVPGYLAYIGGFTRAEEFEKGRGRLLLGVALFVLGFTAVFVSFSIVFATAGLLLLPWLDLITRIAGVIVIVMGLVFIGQVSFLQRTLTPSITTTTGLAGAPLLGIVFGLGWAPCIGPTLIAVNALVLGEGDLGRAALIGTAYSLGLGVPFLLVALGFRWVAGATAWLKRNIRVINIIGGALLIVIGLMMVTGLWQLFVSSLSAVIGGTVTPL